MTYTDVYGKWRVVDWIVSFVNFFVILIRSLIDPTWTGKDHSIEPRDDQDERSSIGRFDGPPPKPPRLHMSRLRIHGLPRQ